MFFNTNNELRTNLNITMLQIIIINLGLQDVYIFPF